MNEPAASITSTNDGTTVLCPECGELMEIHDPRALILTLHLRNECTQTASLFGQGGNE